MAFLQKIISKFIGNSSSENQQRPTDNSKWQRGTEPFITITEAELICQYPSSNKTDKITWDDIIRIDVITTDKGPAVCDVFILITDDNGSVAIPQDREEESKIVIDRIFKLPNFDFEQFIKAMSSAENNTFNVWRKN